MNRLKWVAAVLAIVFVAACGATKSANPSQVSRKPNLITREEIAAVLSDNDNAYDVIRRLRPAFLRTRGVSTMGRSDEPVLVVYLDMVKVSGISFAALRGIASTHIRSIEYLSGIDATTRFGTDPGAGAILVSTRGPVE